MMISTRQFKPWDEAIIEQERSIEHLERPFLQLNDGEYALVLYCTPELYQYVLKLDTIATESDFDIVRMSKLYLEIKKMLKRGIKRVPSARMEDSKPKGETNDKESTS